MLSAKLNLQDTLIGGILSLFRKDNAFTMPSTFIVIKPEEIDTVVSRAFEEKLEEREQYLLLAPRKLANRSYGEHKHKFKLMDACHNTPVFKEVSTYHLKTMKDWNKLNEILNKAEYSVDNFECEEYETMVLYSADEYSKLRMPLCNNGEIDSSNLCICENFIQNDIFAYGSQGTKSETLYFFYIEDIGKYAVVYKNYYCS